MAFGTLIRTRPARAAASAHTARLDPDRLFDEMRRGFFSGPRSAPRPLRGEPRVEGWETEVAYRVRAELPGYADGDFSVEVEDGVLTLKGQIPNPYFEAEVQQDEAQEESAERSEAEAKQYIGDFERRFRFGGPIVEDEVSAQYRNGVLTISVPKTPEEKPQIREIAVEVG